MRSCVKNALKNSHAITYQNLFLCNDLDISKQKKSLFLKQALNVPSRFRLFFLVPLVVGETLKLKLATFFGSDTKRSITLLLTFPTHEKHKELKPDVQVLI